MHRFFSALSLFAFLIGGVCFPQDEPKTASLCSLQETASEGQHVAVRVSGIYSNGPELGTLRDSGCPKQSTLVEFALQSQRNKKKLWKVFEQARSRQVYVVFEGDFYGPPVPDEKLPEAIRKDYHPGWDYESKTKLVVHVIRELKMASKAEP